LHPLVVHVAVVLTPLASLAGLAYAWRSGWRWWLRLPMVVGTVLAGGSVALAYLSGHQLLNQRFALSQGPLRSAIDRHRHWAHWLLFATAAYVLVVLVAAWALGGPSALASQRGARETVASVRVPVLALLVVGAIVVLVLVVLTGDAGAKAVWNP
jgi:hypothetical protein